MKIKMDIGGIGFGLDPAAISCVRYRAEYGESIVNELARCGLLKDAEGLLLRMCHCMMTDRPELPKLAGLASRDPEFLHKAVEAQGRLLDGDPKSTAGKANGKPFDEYDILALMAAAHLDIALIYELPIMHIVSIINRCFDAQGQEETYRKLDDQEMKMLYPR